MYNHRKEVGYMNFVKEEKDVNLKELFLDVVGKWRSIVISSIVAMIVVAIINVPGMIKFKDILGVSVVLIEAIKYSIIAFVVVAAICVVVYAFVYMFSDKIKSVIDYNLSCNLKLLGEIPCNESKRNLFIDKVIKKIRGIKIAYSKRDNLIERVANVILAEIYIRNKEVCKIAVVSSVAENVASEFVDLLDDKITKERVEIVSAGDILTSETSIKQVMEADYVILAERQGKSKYSELEQTCKQLTSWNKEILGTVLLDVDAL